ncbi:protein FAM200B-like [Tachypleus tridentatus]|uniref:protein FAM200B-like n=1 Tax=Tachypleus tridentatus TaxID=6853 RepID=UPI003FD343A6
MSVSPFAPFAIWVIKMLFIVVAVFTICWLPFQTYNILQEVYPTINKKDSTQNSKIASLAVRDPSEDSNRTRRNLIILCPRRAVALRNIQFGSSGIQDQKLQAAVEASYFVAYKVAEQQKCHTIAENLIMPYAYEMVSKDKIKEEFLLCEDLLTTTKREISSISSVSLPQMDWNSVQQVSVDGAPSMMGRNRGLRGLIQAVNPEISVDHCIIHRYSLGSKSLPGNLKLVFEDVLKIVNFIKSRDVNSRIFRELCKEMGEQYQVLLYHTDVRWLSRGKVVRRVIELRTALQEFLKQEESPFATKFTDKEWSARLCYLADIFAELNSDNLQLQGQNTTVIDAHHTVTAFLEN